MKKLIIDKKSLFLQTKLTKDKSLKAIPNYKFLIGTAPIVQRIERKFPKL